MAVGSTQQVVKMTHDELLAEINRYNDGIEVGLIWTTNIFIKALRAVVELHNPNHPFSIKSDLKCAGCDGLDLVDYPCPTIQAIEKELA